MILMVSAFFCRDCFLFLFAWAPLEPWLLCSMWFLRNSCTFLHVCESSFKLTSLLAAPAASDGITSDTTPSYGKGWGSDFQGGIFPNRAQSRNEHICCVSDPVGRISHLPTWRGNLAFMLKVSCPSDTCPGGYQHPSHWLVGLLNSSTPQAISVTVTYVYL